MSAPLTFDFITDEELRSSLRSDYRELESCLQVEAWKAVHVLSGSIVEAVLVDYLLVDGYSKADPLKMPLDKLIEACKSAGVLSDKTADLSSVIRTYRNLIHPGRVKRLDEPVDEEGARIAASLVSMIVREVSAKQEQIYGLTAEQLLSKFEHDSSAFAIAPHLLRDTQPRELERLLLTLLPDRYFALVSESEFLGHDLAAVPALERLYREAFESAPESVKTKAARKFVAVLREDSGERVETYEEMFFRGSDLELLSEKDRKLVKDHLFSRLAVGEMSASMIQCVDGLSAFLRSPELNRLLDPLIRAVAYSLTPAIQKAAADRIESEFRQHLPQPLESQLEARVASWIPFLEERGRPDSAERVRVLHVQLADDDIPF